MRHMLFVGIVLLFGVTGFLFFADVWVLCANFFGKNMAYSVDFGLLQR